MCIRDSEKFHSPVLLPASGVVVGSYRQGIAEAFGTDGICGYAFLDQVVAHRARAVLGQGLIHGIAADVIGVTADFNVESGVGEQNAGDFRQFLPCARLQGIFSGVKQNIGHADDEAASAIASRKNPIQLLGQSGAHRRFVGICPVSYTHLDVYKRQV